MKLSPKSLKEKRLQEEKAISFQKSQQQKLDHIINNFKEFAATPEDMNTKITPDSKWFEQATDAIEKANIFSALIDRQENEALKIQITNKQKIVDACEAENADLQNQLNVLKK